MLRPSTIVDDHPLLRALITVNLAMISDADNTAFAAAMVGRDAVSVQTTILDVLGVTCPINDESWRLIDVILSDQSARMRWEDIGE